MSFFIYCTSCGQKLEAEDIHIGHEMPCPTCNETILISNPSGTNDKDTKDSEKTTDPLPDGSSKLEELKYRARVTFENITRSEQANELGKGLIELGNHGKYVAKGAADNISKSAKIAALQARLKKLESIDLTKALEKLGEKCFVEKTIQAEVPDLYIKIDKLQKEIDGCNDDAMPGMASLRGRERIGRLALRAQLRIQEKKLKGQRREKFIVLGEMALNSEEARRCLAELIDEINTLKKKIAETKESIHFLTNEVSMLFKKPWLLITAALITISLLYWYDAWRGSDDLRINTSKERLSAYSGTGRFSGTIRSLLEKAKMGDAVAQHQLAQYYWNGKEPFKQDWETAENLETKSADQRNPDAEYTLGKFKLMLAVGEYERTGDMHAPNVERLMKEGGRLLIDSARQGNKGAAKTLEEKFHITVPSE